QQQVVRPVDEVPVPGSALLELGELAHERCVMQQRGGVPANVGREPAMEDVEAAQILDAEMRCETLAELVCNEQVEAQREGAAIVQLDLAAVRAMIQTDMACLLERIDEDRRRAADGTDSGDEISSGHARQLCRRNWQVHERQVAQYA